VCWAAKAGVELEPRLRSVIEEGFPKGDDPFDAVVGMFGMLEVVLRRREPGEPQDEPIRAVEGWIFGQRFLGGGR
jgi:hypothetical protein